MSSYEKIDIPIPPALTGIAETFAKRGKQCFLVGGALRDTMLGIPVHEYDLASNAHPKEVMSFFRHTVPTGIEHGTVLVIDGGMEVEVTTFRSDGAYTDGRRPDTVQYADTIEEDVSRRDFTINALAYNLATRDFIDLFGGIQDMHKKIIRTVGDPYERFSEDGLRVMRACRFAAKLGFTIEEETFKAIGASLTTFSKVAAERMRDELDGILLSGNLFIGIELMRTSGMLSIVLPELVEGFGVKQNRFHAYDVYYHNLHSAAAVPQQEDERATRLIRLAALLHDVAKPRTQRKVEKQKDLVYYNHEVVGSSMARRVMKRLKYSRAETEFVEHLIRHHMFYYQDEWTDAAVRRFMNTVGMDNIRSLLTLREADRIGNGKKKRGESEAIPKLLRRIDKIIEDENAITVKDLAVNGNDIMVAFKLHPGPIIGMVLTHCLDLILEEPSLNTKEILLEKARLFLEQAGRGRETREADKHDGPDGDVTDVDAE
ncbi:MAG: HD domain-containing protein [Spirochaetes bacterium]|nr:HD domain-containing protein [Spirochaetota bacterium]